MLLLETQYIYLSLNSRSVEVSIKKTIIFHVGKQFPLFGPVLTTFSE